MTGARTAPQETALVLHPDVVPVDVPRSILDVGTGRTVALPSLAFDLVCALVWPATPRAVIDAIARRRGPAAIADARSTLRGLLSQGLVVPSAAPGGHAGLFGAPLASLAQATSMAAPGVVVAGMPYDAGVSGRSGARGGPAAIRHQSVDLLVHDHVGRAGWFDPTVDAAVLDGVGLADLGDLAPPVADRNGACFDRLERTTETITRAGLVPLVLGGDHSIALPAIRGVARATAAIADRGIGVLHLDAHADLGIDHGPELDWRRGCHHGNVMTWVAADPGVEHLVQVGMRHRTPRPIPCPANVTRLPGVHLAGSVLGAMDPDLSWYVTLDVDVLDPAYVSGTGTPLPGGYDPLTLAALLARIGEERTIVGADVCELIPDRPSEAALAADLLVHLLGRAFDPS